ncbi:hypothetical protein BC938DRAFT_483802 [Jimgerdemannia flammicorona]|uniref:Complex 1 LYR protein domain-containing protein n=1 Tax=Jimgerdemannia flammicorona TaxID=994334 RepID=A0A433R073_9FUNG|nr:hypothetical protein BC938DRAFT_483802 [Jimgerdemannia flammicorona]
MLKAESFRSLYRSLWRAGDASVAHKTRNKLRIRKKIRQAFEDHRAETDQAVLADLLERGMNTITFLETASRRRGIEHSIVENLCAMDFYQSRYDKQPPFWNRKLKEHQRKLHDIAGDEYMLALRMVNETLKLSLR